MRTLQQVDEALAAQPLTAEQLSKERQALQQLMVSQEPATYSVVIGYPAFEAEIRNFYPPSAFQQTYVSQGAQDCGETPSRGF